MFATAAALATHRSLAVSHFCEVRVLVGAEEDFTTLGNSFVTSLVAGVHRFLYLACLYSFHHTTFFFYLKEEVPSLLSDRYGQVFDEVRTGSRVNHLVEVTFFLQQQLLVAGDTFREVVRSLISLVERRNGDRVHTGKGSTHRFCLRTEHIHVSIEQSQVESRSFGVSQHLASTVASRIVFLHDVCPQHTGSTELGDFQEVVRADTEVELDFLGSIVSRYTGFNQSVQVFVTPSEGITQFLSDVRTGIVQFESVYGDATILRESSHNFYQHLGGSDVVAHILTLGEHLAHRVVVDRTLQSSQVVTLLGEVFHEQVSQCNGSTLTSREVQFHTFGTNAFEQCFDIFRTKVLLVDIETERIHTLVQQVECLGIGFLGTFHLDVLTNIPSVVIFLGTSEVRELSRKSFGCLQAFQVFLTVERFHFKSFVGLPNQFLFKVSAFQVGCNLFHPRFGRNARKI